MTLRDIKFLTIWGENKKEKKQREMKMEAILVFSGLSQT